MPIIPRNPNKIDPSATGADRKRRNWQRAALGALNYAIKAVFPLFNGGTSGLSLTINPAGGIYAPTNGLSIELTSPSGLILSTNGLSFNPTTTGGLQITTNGASIKNYASGGLTSNTNGESILLAVPSSLSLTTNGLSWNPTTSGGLQSTTNGASILNYASGGLTSSTNGESILLSATSGLSLGTNGLAVNPDGTSIIFNGNQLSSVPGEVATYSNAGLTNSLSLTTVYTVPTNGAGFYRTSVYVELTTVGTGTLVGTLGWTDDARAQTATIPSIATTADNYSSLDQPMRCSNGTTINLSTTLAGSGTYNIYVKVEKL